MERLAGQAMHIAELAGWTHMKITILFTICFSLFFRKQNKRLSYTIQWDFKIAEDAIDKGDQDIAYFADSMSYILLGICSQKLSFGMWTL